MLPTLAMIGVSRRGTFLQIESLSTPGLTTTSCMLCVAVPQRTDSITVPIVIDPFELAALVISRRGTPVRLIMIGCLVTLPLSVSDSGEVVWLQCLECRTLDRNIALCRVPGTLRLTADPFGTMLIMCIDPIDRLCVTLPLRSDIRLLCMLGVGLSLKCATIGFGRILIMCVLTWKLPSPTLIRWDSFPSALLEHGLIRDPGLLSSDSGGNLLEGSDRNSGTRILCAVCLECIGLGGGVLTPIGLCSVCPIIILCMVLVCMVWILCVVCYLWNVI